MLKEENAKLQAEFTLMKDVTEKWFDERVELQR